MTELIKYEGGNGGMDLAQLGQVLAKSGFFADTRDAAQAIVKVLAGQELGIGPIAAMTGVYLVKGRVAIGANIMAAAVKRSGKYNYRVAELSDTVCRLVFTENGKDAGESTFTAADAKRAGTQNLDKFPRNMLFARALSNGVKWYAPDVFQTTVYTPEELHAGADTGAEFVARPEVVEVVNTATGEITSEPKPAPANERVAAMQAMRAAYDAAVAAGAEVPRPAKEDVKAMTLADIRMWTETYRAEAERVAVQPAEEPEPEF
jgi:hypothetical protein